jgi:hypothetical protein
MVIIVNTKNVSEYRVGLALDFAEEGLPSEAAESPVGARGDGEAVTAKRVSVAS